MNSNVEDLEEEVFKLRIEHNLPRTVHKKILKLLHHPKADSVRISKKSIIKLEKEFRLNLKVPKFMEKGFEYFSEGKGMFL